MTLFAHRDLKLAFLHAERGGQSLLLSRQRDTARLIDHDYDRLYATVCRLGLKAVIANRIGRPGQSIEIRGRQLNRALAECQTPELAL